MFTSCMGIIVLHWYHSPSMQLTTAMTALPPSPTARLVTYDAKCCGSSMRRAYGPPQIDQTRQESIGTVIIIIIVTATS